MVGWYRVELLPLREWLYRPLARTAGFTFPSSRAGTHSPDYVDDRRVGDDASFYPVPCWLTILISPATPALYRYTGLSLVPLISVFCANYPRRRNGAMLLPFGLWRNGG